MNARDIMTKEVVSAGPGTPTRSVAKLLLENGISAVPVVDADGTPIGMVSEGDLIGRDIGEREARRDWWLALLAEGTDLAKEFLEHLEAGDRPVRDVMAVPVITVVEETPVQAIAELLREHRIKRVPVVREGRIVGIVSRADLLRALTQAPDAAAGHPSSASVFGRLVRAVDSSFRHEAAHIAPQTPPSSEQESFSAADFRQFVEAFEHSKEVRASEARRTAAAARSRKVKELLQEHVGEGPWRELLAKAHEAASRGEREFLLLRFPSELCADGGRKINVPEADWPRTLRGEPAELYLYWERALRPRGFGLAARVLDFPSGKPGDIGLFLTWAG